MNYLKVISGVICLTLSLTLIGCETVSRNDSAYAQSMTRAEIDQVQINQQMRAKQRQKSVQNTQHSKIIYKHQPIPSQPYRANVRQSYKTFTEPFYSSQPRGSDYGHDEDDMNRRDRQAANNPKVRSTFL